MTAQGPKRRNTQLSPRERKRANFRTRASTLGESVDSSKSYLSQYSNGTRHSSTTRQSSITEADSSCTQTTYTTRAGQN